MRYLAILALLMSGCLIQKPTSYAPAEAPSVTTLGTQYGNVTFGHETHVRRTESCATCHGPGLFGEPEFDRGRAHELCLSCHRKLTKGPVPCRFCHNS